MLADATSARGSPPASELVSRVRRMASPSLWWIRREPAWRGYDADRVSEIGMVMFHPRPPRPDERALLDSALASMGAEASRWREQASLVEVQGMCDCDCETIDFGFPGTVREAGDHKREILADGTFEGDGVPFGVILHAHDGRLWELEIYSMTGERMGAYPSPGQVVWLPEPHHK